MNLLRVNDVYINREFESKEDAEEWLEKEMFGRNPKKLTGAHKNKNEYDYYTHILEAVIELWESNSTVRNTGVMLSSEIAKTVGEKLNLKLSLGSLSRQIGRILVENNFSPQRRNNKRGFHVNAEVIEKLKGEIYENK